jgi:anti-anti-sigma regulatory factor
VEDRFLLDFNGTTFNQVYYLSVYCRGLLEEWLEFYKKQNSILGLKNKIPLSLVGNISLEQIKNVYDQSSYYEQLYESNVKFNQNIKLFNSILLCLGFFENKNKIDIDAVSKIINNKYVIISLRNAFYADSDGVEYLGELVEILKSSNETIYLSGVNDMILKAIEKETFYKQKLSENKIFERTSDAIKEVYGI